MSTVLIADEDLSSRESIKLLLNSQYQIFTAGTYPQVQETMSQQTIDLALVDTELPGAATNSCSVTLKQQYPELALVLLCSSHERDAIKQAYATDALDYIVKPFDIDRLRFVLSSAMRFVALTHKPEYVVEENVRQPGVVQVDELLGEVSLKQATSTIERKLISHALEKTNNVQTQAAKLLGTTRRILRYKMQQHGLS